MEKAFAEENFIDCRIGSLGLERARSVTRAGLQKGEVSGGYGVDEYPGWMNKHLLDLAVLVEDLRLVEKLEKIKAEPGAGGSAEEFATLEEVLAASYFGLYFMSKTDGAAPLEHRGKAHGVLLKSGLRAIAAVKSDFLSPETSLCLDAAAAIRESALLRKLTVGEWAKQESCARRPLAL